MALFYNQADQDIYSGGDHFIPQEQYRLGKFSNTVAPVPPELTGITNTQAAGSYMGYPSYAAWLAAQGGGGGGGGGLGSLGGKFGNLDLGNTKTFQKRVYNPTGPATGWKMQDITGYYDPTSNTYKTLEGKNIEHGGHFTGDPKQGDIEGEDFQFPGMFAMLKKMKEKAIAAKEKIGGAISGKGGAEIIDIGTAGEGGTTGEGGGYSGDSGHGAYGGGIGGVHSGEGTGGQTTQAAADKAGGSDLNTPFVQGGRVRYNKGGNYAQNAVAHQLFGTSFNILDPFHQDQIDSLISQVGTTSLGTLKKAQGGRVPFFYGGLAGIL